MYQECAASYISDDRGESEIDCFTIQSWLFVAGTLLYALCSCENVTEPT